VLELPLPADESPPQPADATRPHERQRSDQAAAPNARRFALGFDRPRVVELERAADGRSGPLAHQDLSGPGGLLQPCPDVDRVAGDERAALPGPAHDHLARVHPDAECQAIPEHVR
jgi:hypothetical protein